MGGYGMTREEQIREEDQKHGLNCISRINYQDGFIEGAKWADKTMIDKACEWIKNNKHLYKVLSFGSLSTDWDKFIREFRKAMEE